MAQQLENIPETDFVVPCQRSVNPDAIYRQIKERGPEFAKSEDAALLRTASTWLVKQHVWVRTDLQLEVYGRQRWVFYAGDRCNQVAFNARDDGGEADALWERKGWRKTSYDGTKVFLKVIGIILPLAAPAAFFIPVAGPILAPVMGIAGIAALVISEAMEEDRVILAALHERVRQAILGQMERGYRPAPQ